MQRTEGITVNYYTQHKIHLLSPPLISIKNLMIQSNFALLSNQSRECNYVKIRHKAVVMEQSVLCRRQHGGVWLEAERVIMATQ